MAIGENNKNPLCMSELFRSADTKLNGFFAECDESGVSNAKLTCMLRNGKSVSVDLFPTVLAEQPSDVLHTPSSENAIHSVSTDRRSSTGGESDSPDDISGRRQLSAQLQEARDQERSEIGREIHDELGQVLATVRMGVSSLAEEYADHQHLTKKIGDMERLLSRAIRTVQRISAQLRPAVLDILGLAAAIEWQSMNFQKTSGISCNHQIRISAGYIDPKVKIAIFRILQEGLTNVIRHADASEVKITLKQHEKWFVLSVQDNGKGIAVEPTEGVYSIGIRGMQERAFALGGRVKIISQAKQGTTVIARIPFSTSGDTP
jgi:signal transduction histidine kinase